MEISLKGKKAIVTGSSRGVGFSIAEKLALSGATVLLNGRSEQGVQEAIMQLKQSNPLAEVTGCAADISTKEGFQAIVNTWNKADILIHNAGVYEPKPFLEINDDEWEYYVELHILGAVRLSRHYIKGMTQNNWGRVLFNGSVTGGFFSGEMVHYGTTKAALLGLSRGIAESVSGSGVTVNTFLPGPTKTEKVQRFIENEASRLNQSEGEFEKKLFHDSLPTSIINRFVTPEEVANLVVFLASNQASAITGATLKVDGGIVRSIL
ncbi:SDR family NAD(P)-dependent oxidoreductase [Bacillus salitolerans]|uniref:SDR family NAD(P)-dependent oxidoreductase n=1 Tax=Bacillus salitolerans TaxID=1437434 RepID=A0ABW4LVM9_9BACI